MAHPARFLTTTLLVAGLALPVSLQASGLPGPRQATHDKSSTSSQAAESWSFDRLVGLFQRAWTKAGGYLDLNGSRCLQPSPGASIDAGPNLDPNGGNTPRPPHRARLDAGPNLDPNGGGK
jgi:hypothetical protein